MKAPKPAEDLLIGDMDETEHISGYIQLEAGDGAIAVFIGKLIR